MTKNIVIGILAHVDAGKTTLTEGILYRTGELRSLGRVDNRNTLFDSNEMERERGITIFSKQACFHTGSTFFSMLDTPGHVDFSAEMERTLQVLDYAVLVISASDGVQGHTRTLWRLLARYHIPVFIFVNKMDQPDNDRLTILNALKRELAEGCVDFCEGEPCGESIEELAVLSSKEELLNYYLENGIVPEDEICCMVRERRVFPCYFGSALKLYGIDGLIAGLDKYTVMPSYGGDFGAKVYKITRDAQGNRLTHVKLTGGTLHVRDVVTEDEKVNQIRIYGGEKYEAVNAVQAGSICALTGLLKTYAGQGLGADKNSDMCLLAPVLSYSIRFPDNVSKRQVYPGLKQLEEELPELGIEWNETTEEILVRLMGPVQLEILGRMIAKRFGFTPEFDTGRIIYKESIDDTVIGVGHFEPLRHYAEVHLLLEPGERGSGLMVTSDLSEDKLDGNWQRMVLGYLRGKNHAGVLTGSAITDIKITLINGRAHQKHTEGGDFRQAALRALRQGLMQAETVLLEPYYRFRLELPAELIGRAMTDIENMCGRLETPIIEGEHAVLTGLAPVAVMQDYQLHVSAFTRGTGNLYVDFGGYDRCHNTEEIVASFGYEPENDTDNPVSSVFCAHGAGFIVPWYQVKEYMHVTDEEKQDIVAVSGDRCMEQRSFEYSIDLNEIEEIFDRTFGANRRTDKRGYTKKRAPEQYYEGMSKSRSKGNRNRERLLLVDGYNVIFAWDELKALAEINIDSAKDRLIQILSNYQGTLGCELILVFDGYKVKGNPGSRFSQDNITVVHTRENETADQYIEKFTHEKGEIYNITVATSDGMIQQIVSGVDCRILSSARLLSMIEEAAQRLRDEYHIEPE